MLVFSFVFFSLGRTFNWPGVFDRPQCVSAAQQVCVPVCHVATVMQLGEHSDVCVALACLLWSATHSVFIKQPWHWLRYNLLAVTPRVQPLSPPPPPTVRAAPSDLLRLLACLLLGTTLPKLCTKKSIFKTLESNCSSIETRLRCLIASFNIMYNEIIKGCDGGKPANLSECVLIKYRVKNQKQNGVSWMTPVRFSTWTSRVSEPPSLRVDVKL